MAGIKDICRLIYNDWCECSKNLGFDIKTLNDEVAELKATIGSKASLLASLDSMIDVMVGTLKGEQKDDDLNKEYCNGQLDVTDDKEKAVECSLEDAETA